MGRLKARYNFSRKHLIYFWIFAVYLIAGAAFLYFGLQPVSSEEVYARESAVSDGRLIISGIDLDTPTVAVKLNGNDLEVPDQIAGSYSAHANKTLLLGHSSTVFKNLKEIDLAQLITYDGKPYIVTAIEEKAKEDISMKKVLQAEDIDTIVLMTCSGEEIGNTNDYTHRLIITAEAA
ncbi:class F sortase [Candidatus Saccharibacteria bacterium]|nr:class F sortase [Candidatus Saccharibacteria bacterium]